MTPSPQCSPRTIDAQPSTLNSRLPMTNDATTTKSSRFRATRRGHAQVRLPQARADVPPGPQPQQSRTRPRSSSEASEAYAVLSDPEKRARYDQFGHAGVGAGAGGAAVSRASTLGLRRLLGSLQRHLRVRRRLRRRGLRSRRRKRSRLPDGDHVRGRRARRRGADRDLAAGGLRRLRGSRSRRRARSRATCPACRGTGRQRFSQGFLTVTRPCGTCRGDGRVIDKPCPGCRGEGRRRGKKELTIKIPAGVETGTRLRLTGEGRRGPERRPCRRPLRRADGRGARDLRARGRRPHPAARPSLSHARAGRRGRGPDARGPGDRVDRRRARPRAPRSASAGGASAGSAAAAKAISS